MDSANFFQITAGDYNNDGKDTLVIYDGGQYLRELTVNVNAADTSATTGTSFLITSSTPYFNTTYMDYKMYNSGINYRLCVSLESGDVNGDGIDDLVVASCTGDVPEMDKYKDTKNETCKTTLAVGFGKTGSSLSSATVQTSTI